MTEILSLQKQLKNKNKQNTNKNKKSENKTNNQSNNNGTISNQNSKKQVITETVSKNNKKQKKPKKPKNGNSNNSFSINLPENYFPTINSTLNPSPETAIYIEDKEEKTNFFNLTNINFD